MRLDHRNAATDRMSLLSISLLWAFAGKIIKGKGVGIFRQKLKFVLQALVHHDSVKRFIEAAPNSLLGRAFAARPEILGALIWPYQCIGWSAGERLFQSHQHYEAADAIGSPFNITGEAQFVLATLDQISPGVRAIIDQPIWFLREGQLTLNLFDGDTRLYTLAFSLQHRQKKIAAVIGAIQGRDIEGALDRYRALTKQAEGLRPRDLLLEIFRLVCAHSGIDRILAISDEFRIHRSSYFGAAGEAKIHSNYNDIWKERGGYPSESMFYELNIESSRRSLEAIPAKKRGAYRRRYALLDQIEQQVKENCGAAVMPDMVAARMAHCS